MKILPGPPISLIEAVGLHLLFTCVCEMHTEQSVYAIICSFFVLKIPKLLAEIARMEDD